MYSLYMQNKVAIHAACKLINYIIVKPVVQSLQTMYRFIHAKVAIHAACKLINYIIVKPVVQSLQTMVTVVASADYMSYETISNSK